jgi:hypothetical protein
MSKLDFYRKQANQCTVNAGLTGLPEIANLWDEVARSYRLLIVLEEREIALQASGCARS